MKSLEFTGERFIPGQGGAQISYEHLHRYLYAAHYAKGKSVLDVASGAGYGAALLAPAARMVWAVELDGPAVAHARNQCPVNNVAFIQADATRLPFPNGCAGLVVALEILEHVTDQELLVHELARVAARNAVVFISTPNKAAYSDARGYRNPFHVREFYRDEFLDLLSRNFDHVSLFAQQVRGGSLISPEYRTGQVEILAEPRPDMERAPSDPMYFLAACSHTASNVLPTLSAYLDPSDLLLAEWEESRKASGLEIQRLNGEIEKLGDWGAELREKVRERDATIEHVLGEVALRDQIIYDLNRELAEVRGGYQTLESEIGQRDQTILQQQQDFAERTRWVEDLQKEIGRRDDQLVEINRIADDRDREIHRLSSELGGIRKTFLYRALARLGLFPR
jgi:O-antigen biosynthesis protein